MADKRYTAIFDAQDRVSDKLKRIEQATTRARDAQGRFIASTKRAEDAQERIRSRTDRATNSIDRLRRAALLAGHGFASFGSRSATAIRTLGGGLKGIASTITSLPALITGAGAAFGAWKLGSSVLGGAMQKELSQLQMGALLADQNKGQNLFKIVQDKAMTSMFSEKDFSKAATTFLPITKDFGDIERLMSINERLASSNLLEGMEGASFSLREALSGDITSIAERFNISKSSLRSNGFSAKGSWEKNLEAVDRTLNKMGYTAKYVDQVNDAAYSQWELFKSNSLKLFSDTGEGILGKLKEPLKQLNFTLGSEKMTQFVDKLSDTLAGKFEDALTYVEDMNLQWDDFTRLLSGAGGIFSGVGDSFAIMMGTFDGKEGKSPREKFEQFAEAIESGATAIDDFNKAFEPFIDVVRSFADFGTGFYSKDEDGRKQKGLLRWAGDALTGKGTDWYYTPGEQASPWKLFKDTFKTNGELFDRLDFKFNPNAGGASRLGSHMGGLSYVPSDGYVTQLHKGERVLTAQQNRDYAKGNGVVTIQIQNMQVRNESDIDAIGKAIARELRLKGAM